VTVGLRLDNEERAFSSSYVHVLCHMHISQSAFRGCVLPPMLPLPLVLFCCKTRTD